MTGNKNNKFGKRLQDICNLEFATRLSSIFANRAAGTKENSRLNQKRLEIEKASVITQYLNGKTVNEIARVNALTREFVRNAITEYNNRPQCCVMNGVNGIHNTHCEHFTIEDSPKADKAQDKIDEEENFIPPTVNNEVI